MRGWRGFLAGALGLVMLQTVVANRQANDRAAGLPGLAVQATRRLLDPTVPAFGATATKPAGVDPRNPTQPGRGLDPAHQYPAPIGPSAPGYPDPSTVPVRPPQGSFTQPGVPTR